ncbi:transmembrane protease serine 11B-like protein [Carassius gibelio]|uniref:transmembrane protease serine 11B-like protein n=1 Tax=Carassius gibelio TaxID=101364 RepID=UPI002277A3DE|nr:transmembrane protease serine 11B-like protein [Carassius gibelio]
MYFTAPRDCYVTGWGSLFSGGSSSQMLQEAKIQLIDRTTCNSRAVYNGQITDTMICAGKLEGGVDSCERTMFARFTSRSPFYPNSQLLLMLLWPPSISLSLQPSLSPRS